MPERFPRILAMLLALLVLGLVQAAGARAATSGMQCTTGQSFDLTTGTGHIETPDGNSLFMWGYAPTGQGFQYPGPVLCVTAGQPVTVHLHNTLPEASSISFPGIDGVSSSGGTAGPLVREAAAGGGDVTYTFTPSSPGTYLYQSASDPAKQVEMGLFGALVVRPAGHPDWAYGASSQFDPSREYLQLLDELDPDQHRAVELGGDYDITKQHPRYYTINGRAFPDTLQANGVSWLPTQPYGALVRIRPYCNPANLADPANPPACKASSPDSSKPALIRIVNAGTLNHPFHPHGNDLTMVGVDGRPLQAAGGGDAFVTHFAETVPAGGTEDFLLPWKDRDSSSATNNPLPVTLPSYRNEFFKDHNTWFSGSPYLGTQGTLPVGTTSQNVCGELYFPWHSHALNEFTNYDASFGGMATLLRVDPIDGCAKVPASASAVTGTATAGSYASLAAVDTALYTLSSAAVAGTPTTQYEVGFTGVQVGSQRLRLAVTGRCSVTSCTQKVAAYQWASATWQTVDTTTTGAAGADGTRAALALPDGSVGTGSSAGKVRVRVTTTRPSGTFSASGNALQLNYDTP